MCCPDSPPPQNNNEDDVEVSRRRRVRPRSPLKVYIDALSEDSLERLKQFHARIGESNLSLNELIAFTFDAEDTLLARERRLVCISSFQFSAIQHNDELVDLYTGLPDANRFNRLVNILQRTAMKEYNEWDHNDKQGFATHTLIALMKLRIGMTDEELAERFQVELRVINKTLKLWIPAMTRHVYKACEEVYRFPVPCGLEPYTKVIDIVEVCKETPPYTIASRGYDKKRRAVLIVRSDGYVCFASRLFSQYVPDAALIQRSKFQDTISNIEVMLTRPDLQEAVSSLGIACDHVTEHSIDLIEAAVDRICRYRVLTSIPKEYEDIADDFYKVCATLSNFSYTPQEDEREF